MGSTANLFRFEGVDALPLQVAVNVGQDREDVEDTGACVMTNMV